ncbi:uncharacterized protein LOC121694073 [Alosa sapidissima]|uniref:uncharacterized protein LOC121694073 n=1 Tax=Alosa sapidissima TaxID=34773 RepID=UPI001C08F09D|nr:uncharacterized protein LOC121694073 [Alosa sapidissima]
MRGLLQMGGPRGGLQPSCDHSRFLPAQRRPVPPILFRDAAETQPPVSRAGGGDAAYSEEGVGGPQKEGGPEAGGGQGGKDGQDHLCKKHVALPGGGETQPPVSRAHIVEKDPTTPNRNRFYGYLVAFVVALYGHRPGVLVMTTMNECSVCGRVYTAMSYHLVTRHLVINTEERAILLNLASGRTPIRSDPCPAVGCAYHSSQLDKHLKGHSELTPAQRARLLKSAKERKALRLLADLRATNPSVPMATALDLAQEEGQVGEAPQPQQEAPGEEEDVGEETWALSQEVRSVRAKVATLTRALASARRWGRLQSLHLRRATGPPSLPPLMAGQGRRKATYPRAAWLELTEEYKCPCCSYTTNVLYKMRLHLDNHMQLAVRFKAATITQSPASAPAATITQSPASAPAATITQSPGPAAAATITQSPASAPAATITQSPASAPAATITQSPASAPVATITQSPASAPAATITQSPASAPAATITQSPASAPAATITQSPGPAAAATITQSPASAVPPPPPPLIRKNRETLMCPHCSQVVNRRNVRVTNSTERSILLQLGMGRIRIRTEPCPVPSCSYRSSRLDKHLAGGHSELTTAEREKLSADAKRIKALSLLRALRASNPQPPMVSTLDIDEGDEVVADEGGPDECQEPGCAAVRRENASLKAQVKSLGRELEISRRRSRALARRLRRLNPGAPISEEEEEPAEPDVEPPQPEGSEEEEPEPQPVPSGLSAKTPTPATASRRRGQRGATSRRQRAPNVTAPSPAAPTVPAQVVKKEPISTTAAATPAAAKLAAAKLATATTAAATTETEFEDVSKGKGRASGLRNIKFPESIEAYLAEYQAHHSGTASSGRARETALSKVSRVRSFLFFLAQRKKDVWNWLFLDNPGGLRRWVEKLQEGNRAVTTVNFYLRNVQQFLKYFKDTKPKLCRLSHTQIVGVVRGVDKALRDLRKIEVKRVKMTRVVSPANLKICREMVRKKIPKCLKALAEDNCIEALAEDNCIGNRQRFYGYFATWAEKQGCVEEGYIVNVDDHKTAHSFDAAQLFLWLGDWVAMRGTAHPQPRKDNKLLFFTSGRGPSKDMNSHRNMGLPGRPIYTDIRMAVSSYAKRVHGSKIRNVMTQYMCHDTKTADKFYALSLNVAESRLMRERFDATTSEMAIKKMTAQRLSHAGRKPELPSSSSEDEKASASTSAPSSPASVATPSVPRKRTKKTDRRSSTSSYQESGSSVLNEELEDMERALRELDRDSSDSEVAAEEAAKETTPKKVRRVVPMV